MPNKFLTLLDATKLNGTDSAVGLIEEVNTVAPELNSLLGRPINGITYKIAKRKAFAGAGSNPFRNVNEGTDLLASAYEQDMGQCFFLDGQLQVDEALVESGVAEGGAVEDILASEASSVMQQKTIDMGTQFYYGQNASSKGFNGLQSLYDPTNCVIDAGGTGNNTSSVYLVWNNIKGLHWVYGNNTGLMMGEWFKQQVKDGNNKAFMAWVNNAKAWLGLFFGHSRCVVRIKNLASFTATNNKGLTDALVAAALAKMPIFMRMDTANLKLFVNSAESLALQQSRSTVVGAKTDSGILQFAPQPVESNNVRIVLTDSLTTTEVAS